MCYMVREQPAGVPERASAPTVPGLDRLRPRWVAAIGATLLGGLALAAFVDATPSPPQLSARASAAPMPIAARSTQAPSGPVVEQTALPMDDGVPGAPDGARAAIGPCHHGL